VPETTGDRRRAQPPCLPGNIRELANVVHATLLTARDGIVRPENLRLAVRPTAAAAPSRDAPTQGFRAIRVALRGPLEREAPGLHEQLEVLIVRAAYAVAQDNQVRATGLLRLTRNTLRTRLEASRAHPPGS
jgi:sigma-54 dependent transcriptional regulator